MQQLVTSKSHTVGRKKFSIFLSIVWQKQINKEMTVQKIFHLPNCKNCSYMYSLLFGVFMLFKVQFNILSFNIFMTVLGFLTPLLTLLTFHLFACWFFFCEYWIILQRDLLQAPLPPPTPLSSIKGSDLKEAGISPKPAATNTVGHLWVWHFFRNYFRFCFNLGLFLP